MLYMILRIIEGDECWSFVNTMDDLHEAREVARKDAVKHGSYFSDAHSYWSDATKEHNTFWRGRWSRQTADGRIFYEVIAYAEFAS